jgi:hypothetical protein
MCVKKIEVTKRGLKVPSTISGMIPLILRDEARLSSFIKKGAK